MYFSTEVVSYVSNLGTTWVDNAKLSGIMLFVELS